jgi:hypothetical protein
MVNIYHGKFINWKLSDKILPDFGSDVSLASAFLL